MEYIQNGSSPIFSSAFFPPQFLLLPSFPSSSHFHSLLFYPLMISQKSSPKLPLKVAKDNTRSVFNQCGVPPLLSFHPIMGTSVSKGKIYCSPSFLAIHEAPFPTPLISTQIAHILNPMHLGQPCISQGIGFTAITLSVDLLLSHISEMSGSSLWHYIHK